MYAVHKMWPITTDVACSVVVCVFVCVLIKNSQPEIDGQSDKTLIEWSVLS